VAKVLLIQPPHVMQEGKITRGAYFPLELGYISSILLQDKHQVEILDLQAFGFPQHIVEKRIEKARCDVVCISAYPSQFNYVKWLSGLIKRTLGCKVVICGSLATFSTELILGHTDADICVIGEGEATMKELLLSGLSDLPKVDGIAYKFNGQTFKNKIRPQIEDLDNLPLPVFDLFPMEIYIKRTPLLDFDLSKRTYSVTTGRGYPFKCNYCSSIFDDLRIRSVDNVIKEIIYVKEKYHINSLTFSDELFALNKKRACEFIERLKHLKLSWSCQVRVDIVDYELMKAMKKAGCVAIGFSLGSGSPKILRNMDKSVTPEQQEEALKAAIKAGLKIKTELIFGYPGETKETVEETINFMKKVGYPGGAEFSVATALPGTQLYDYALQKGYIKDELKYLEQLAYAFNRDRPVLINFTDFQTNDFYPMIKDIQKKMAHNCRYLLLKHPVRFFREITGKLRSKAKFVWEKILREKLLNFMQAVLYYLGIIKLGLLIRKLFGEKKVLVLCYHKIYKDRKDKFFLTVDMPLNVFKKQIEYICRNYKVISLQEALDCLEQKAPIPQNSIVITFDDSTKDEYRYAFPIFKEYNINATFFLATQVIDSKENTLWVHKRIIIEKAIGIEKLIQEMCRHLPYLQELINGNVGFRDMLKYQLDSVTRTEVLDKIFNEVFQNGRERKIAEDLYFTWDEVKEMANAGMLVGSHTVTHPVLSMEDIDSIREEIFVSKKRIEEAVGAEVNLFSYPFGDFESFDGRVKKILREAGFRCAFACGKKGKNDILTDKYALNRIVPYDNESIYKFAYRLFVGS